MKKGIMLILLAVTLLVGCEQIAKKSLTGKWRLITEEGGKIEEVIELNDDNTYSYKRIFDTEVIQADEVGTWSLKVEKNADSKLLYLISLVRKGDAEPYVTYSMGPISDSVIYVVNGMNKNFYSKVE
jgi:hypothetical protein